MQKEKLQDDELILSRSANKVSSIRHKSLRLNLVLPDKSASRLEKLKELTEASSYTEVIRNAIRLYEAMVMEYEKGNKVQIVDKDGHPTGVNIF
ncbi:MAG: ribbon-helix-helix protein, CopG family [Rhizobiales bacterium]|nr:ribbon-helix-helix protein, CopG family [Hyphomicrobiales bacterium]